MALGRNCWQKRSLTGQLLLHHSGGKALVFLWLLFLFLLSCTGRLIQSISCMMYVWMEKPSNSGRRDSEHMSTSFHRPLFCSVSSGHALQVFDSLGRLSIDSRLPIHSVGLLKSPLFGSPVRPQLAPGPETPPAVVLASGSHYMCDSPLVSHCFKECAHRDAHIYSHVCRSSCSTISNEYRYRAGSFASW